MLGLIIVEEDKILVLVVSPRPRSHYLGVLLPLAIVSDDLSCLLSFSGLEGQ